MKFVRYTYNWNALVASLLLASLLVFSGCSGSSTPESTVPKTTKQDAVKPRVKAPDVQKPPQRSPQTEVSLDYKSIEQLTVPGYKPDKSTKITEHALEKRLIAQKALPSGWKLAVDVRVGRCVEGDFRCWSLTDWQNKQNPARLALPEVHRHNPELVIMTTPVKFGKAQVVSVYLLSFVEHTGQTRIHQKSQLHSFALYATNGSHYLTLTSHKLSGIAGNLEELKEKLPRTVLTNETRRVFSVYRQLIAPPS